MTGVRCREGSLMRASSSKRVLLAVRSAPASNAPQVKPFSPLEVTSSCSCRWCKWGSSLRIEGRRRLARP